MFLLKRYDKEVVDYITTVPEKNSWKNIGNKIIGSRIPVSDFYHASNDSQMAVIMSKMTTKTQLLRVAHYIILIAKSLKLKYFCAW